MADKKQTQFTVEDVRILRESLAWCYKKAPAQIKKKIHDDLLRFSNAIKDRCQCEDKSWVEREKKFACLNCGRRHKKAKGDPVLEVVE